MVSTESRLFRRAILPSTAGLALAVLLACGGSGTGDTDGGQGNDTAAPGSQYVDNGGAGASISFFEVPSTIGVGDIEEFVVELRDPRGAPLDNVQVACDSELGIAIIEPSTGREHTNVNGRMSGRIGGLQDGSFLFECRAETGLNLHVRKSIRVVGPGPDGFAGFPGAAGGTMGGGVIDTDDGTGSGDDSGDITVTAITFSQGGTSTTNSLDTSRDIDCNPIRSGSPEPFSNPTYSITLKNESEQTLTIESITVAVQDGNGTRFTQSQGIDVAAGGTVTLTDLFYSAPVTGADGPNGVAVFPDGTTAINGTFNVRFTINGTFENGNDVSVTRQRTITLQNIDRCSASS